MSAKFLYLLVFVIAQFCTLIADPVVHLPNGLIQGREDVTIKNKTFYAFEKIPYAAPPVGDLRFQAPVPPQNWEGVLETTHLDVLCFQLLEPPANEKEECLYINVFTPQLPDKDNNVSLPVMVFIHGGGFIAESSAYYKSDLIVENDLVFVNFDYRLGPFGFLSTQDDVIPGNAGLKDQHLALQWVHDNVHLFGGDPEKVTIFGQSAGAASVSYHLLNQQSQGLFRGAIIQSGSCISPWAYQRNARQIAFATAALIDESFTNSNDSVALFDFLKNVDASVLKAAAEKYKTTHPNPEFTEMYQGIFSSPVIEVKNENAFITKKQYGLLQAGNTVRVPILLGITSEESLEFTEFTTEENLSRNLQGYDEHLDWLVADDMNVEDEARRQEIGLSIREIYTGDEKFADHLGAGARFYSDSGFTKPMVKHAELYSKFAPTYFYQFSYKGLLGGNNVSYEGADSVGHSEDLYYIFCTSQVCAFSGYSESDQVTSERMVKIWTNFAKYQNPTPEPSELLQNITWPKVSTENGDFLYVDINKNLEIKNHPKEDVYRKWIEIYDSLDYSDFDTY